MRSLKPLISAVMLTAASSAFANPQGFNPLVGEATLSLPNAHTLEVTTGKQAIIQWDSFSIDASETTRFVMPDSRSSVLNRVLGGDMSHILGTLEANGKVFLINPKGVLVGEDAMVNTASFIASSFDVLNDSFLSGSDIVFSGTSGSVTNLGKITAWDGDVLLVGFQVRNEGQIDAPSGVAALAAGTEIFLRPAHNERILVRASLQEIKADVGVANTGSIQALQTELKADGNLYSFAIKDSGRIDALAKCRRGNNKIFLVADKGVVETSGQLTAPGGEIRIFGDDVAILSGASIDVSSENGGGLALIGGDFRGAYSEIANARYVRVEENVSIAANGLTESDGGTIVLWSEALTSFFGNITAEGGELAGHGGLVEISSVNLVNLIGDVSTLAPHGNTGTLLIDPVAVTIAGNSATESGFAPIVPCPSASNPTGFDFTGSASSVIKASTITSLLTCTNVIVDASATGTAATGSISVEAPLNWATSNSLTLTASDGIGSFIDLLSNVTNVAGGSLTINGTTVNVGDNGASLTVPVNVNVSNVTVTAVDLVVHGSNNTGASAQLQGKNVTLNLSGNLLIQGGDAQNAFAAINAAGNSAIAKGSITANVTGNVDLTAGNGPSSSAAMSGINADIAIGSGMASVATVSLTASDSASYANAFIATYQAGHIEINSIGDVTLDAGIMPGCNADIFTVGSDANDSHITITTTTGDVVLKGGGA